MAANVINDERTLREYEAAVLADAQAFEKDLRTVMSTPSGRRIIWEILEFTKPFHVAFTGNSTGFFLEGKRSVGLWLYQQLNDTCFNLFLEARRENYNRQKEMEVTRG